MALEITDTRSAVVTGLMEQTGEDPGTLLVAFLRGRARAPGSGCVSELRALVDGLRLWTPRILQRTLHSGWRRDVSADAVQHLLLAITEGKADHLADVDQTHAIRWVRRVLVNFAIDQVRHVSRSVPMEDHGIHGARADTFEAALCTRDEFVRLADKLRHEALFAASPRSAGQRARLVEDYFASVLTARQGPDPMRARNTFDQRRCRGRRTASVAWRAFRGAAEAEAAEFREVAAALGLDAQLRGIRGRKPTLDG